MATNKKCIVQKNCSRFCVVALSMFVASTALGNYVSAADVYPTITSTHSNSSTSIGELWNSFTEFVVSGLEKSTSENDYTILANNPAKKVEKTDSFSLRGSEVIKFSFSDIAGDENNYYIEELAQKGIVSTKNDKFYPDNFIRLNELVKMIVNSYRYRVGYSLNGDAGLTDNNYFDVVMPKYYNTAYEMGLLDGLSNIDDFERFVSEDDLDLVFKNFHKQYPNLIHLHYYEEPKDPRTLRRGYVAKAIYRSLMLDIEGNIAYGDSAYHKNGEAIQILADLGISNTGNLNFYPDQNITRGDFITLLVNSYLQQNNSSLTVSDFDLSISDLDYNSPYAQYVMYAKENGFIDYLLETWRGNTYIRLDDAMTKNEVYHILSQVAGVNINYDEVSADTQTITRGEVAELLVNSFYLNNGNKNSILKNSQLSTLISNIKGSIEKGKKIAALL